MAVRSIAQLKGYFETGDFPTQEQFADLIDSMRHVRANVPLADVEGLVAAINDLVAVSQLGTLLEQWKVRLPITGSGIVNTTVALPVACLVREVLVWAPGGCTLTLTVKNDSTTAQEVTCPAGGRAVVLINTWFAVDDTIHFSGSTAEFNYQINTY